MLQFYQILLEKRGYETFLYRHPGLCPLNGLAACGCPVGTCCSDVIISDLQMPGINGLVAIEELRKRNCKQPQVAIISGSWTEEAMERAASLGCKALSKPIHAPELVAWLEEVERAVPPNRRLFDWHRG
jgi:CheY-like chemotaxis protein